MPIIPTLRPTACTCRALAVLAVLAVLADAAADASQPLQTNNAYSLLLGMGNDLARKRVVDVIRNSC